MANDWGNPVNNFLYDLDLFGIGAFNYPYLGIRTYIDYATSTTWKEIQNIAFNQDQNGQKDIISQNALSPTPIFTNKLDQPGIFELVLGNIGVKNQDLPVLKSLSSEKKWKVVCNHIDVILSLNYL